MILTPNTQRHLTPSAPVSSLFYSRVAQPHSSMAIYLQSLPEQASMCLQDNLTMTDRLKLNSAGRWSSRRRFGNHYTVLQRTKRSIYTNTERFDNSSVFSVFNICSYYRDHYYLDLNFEQMCRYCTFVGQYNNTVDVVVPWMTLKHSPLTSTYCLFSTENFSKQEPEKAKRGRGRPPKLRDSDGLDHFIQSKKSKHGEYAELCL